MNNNELLHSPLQSRHESLRGKLVDFAGWLMPIQYQSIIDEHIATRQRIGVFDVSHMGRLKFSGSDAGTWLDRLTTRRVADMKVGQIRYSLMCNEHGGILDDVLVYRLSDNKEGDFFALVVNAGNRSKIVGWLNANRDPKLNAGFIDETEATAMIAIQGPKALLAMQSISAADLMKIPYYQGVLTTFAGVPATVSRTGYTGEDGIEVTVAADRALATWDAIFSAGAAAGILAAGLGARDTLRLESAMPLYGHELGEGVTPFQAKLKFAVSLDGRTFMGKERIVSAMHDPELPILVGLEMPGKRAAREHCPVVAESRQIGEITSGSYSPTLDKSIAMAYIHPSYSSLGTVVEIDVRGRLQAATVVKLPFYKRV
jgi:aminomethyltransferase